MVRIKKTQYIETKKIDLPSNLKDVNAINKFFTSNINNSAIQIDLQHFYLNNFKENITEDFYFNDVSEDVVNNIIYNIKSKAYGMDDINIIILHFCCPFLLPIITHIINECLKNSYFPESWKFAKVLPLPKVTLPEEYSDLRSIR